MDPVSPSPEQQAAWEQQARWREQDRWVRAGLLWFTALCGSLGLLWRLVVAPLGEFLTRLGLL